MNKTPLLILCDFLLLNLIHFTAWDKLDKESESSRARGGAEKAGVMGDPTRDLELAAVRIKEREEDLKNQMASVAALRNALTSTQEEMGNELARQYQGQRIEQRAKPKKKERAVKMLRKAALNEAKRLAILKEFEKQQARAAEAKQEREELANNNKDLTNRISQLTASMGDLNVNLTNTVKQLNDEKGKVSDLSAELRAAEAIAEREKQAATAAKTEAIAAQKVAATANTRAASQCRSSGSQEQRSGTNRKIESMAEKRVQAANTIANTALKRVETAQAEVVATTKAKAQVEQALAATSAEKQELTKAVINEKQDKEIAQAAAQQLRDEIAKKIPDQPINANMMATLYSQNRVNLLTTAARDAFQAQKGK